MDFAGPIIGIESGGNPNAQNPRSSALGPGQFLNSTWLGMIRKYHPEMAQIPDNQVLGLRTDPGLSREMTDKYAQENQAYLQSKGLPVTPGTTYLGHFLGPAGAAKVLQADPGTPMENIVGSSVMAANPFLRGMTAGQMAPWAEGKMGAQPLPPATDVASAPPIGPPLGAPQSPTQQPLPAGAPQQPQQLPAQVAPVASPQAPQQQFAQPPPLQLLQAFRPQVNMQPLQQYMANLHPALRGFSFSG